MDITKVVVSAGRFTSQNYIFVPILFFFLFLFDELNEDFNCQ